MSNMQAMFDELQSYPKLRSCGDVSHADIEEIESALSVKVSDDYQAFLLRFGYAACYGQWIFGVSRPRPPSAPAGVLDDSMYHTIRRTLAMRKELAEHFPDLESENLVAVSDDGSGGYIVMYGENTGKPGVVEWMNPEDSDEPIQAWPDFGSYFRSWLDDVAIGAQAWDED